MRVAVVIEQRFSRTPDGRVWTESSFPYASWEEHLRVFSSVLVIARVGAVPAASPLWARADGKDVDFLDIPYYVGPFQYARKSWRIGAILRRAPIHKDAVLLRIPSQIASRLQPILERRGQPYAVQVAGDPYDLFAPAAMKHILRAFFRWRFSHKQRIQCFRAHACAYVTANALQRRYAPDPSAFTTHFSDAWLPQSAFVSSPPRLPRLPAHFLIVTVASLSHPYKGVDLLIDAAAICQKSGIDLRLTVVGDGRLRRQLRQQADNNGLSHRVTFSGFLSQPEAIRAYLDQADLFVLPSRTEGLPRAMLEAMARGLPCLGTAVGGIPELLAPEDLVPSSDAIALASKIQQVLLSPDRMAQASRRNLEKARGYSARVQHHRSRLFLEHLRQVTAQWCATESRNSSPVRLAPAGGNSYRPIETSD